MGGSSEWHVELISLQHTHPTTPQQRKYVCQTTVSRLKLLHVCCQLPGCYKALLGCSVKQHTFSWETHTGCNSHIRASKDPGLLAYVLTVMTVKLTKRLFIHIASLTFSAPARCLAHFKSNVTKLLQSLRNVPCLDSLLESHLKQDQLHSQRQCQHADAKHVRMLTFANQHQS